MDFSFTEEQQSLRDLAAQILDDLVSDAMRKDFEGGKREAARGLWSQLAQANLLGVALPEDVGGLGLGIVELALLLEQQGRTLAPIPLLPTLVLGALPIAEFGTPEQGERLLTPVANGTQILSAALIELGAPDPAAPRVTATRTEAGWRLNGEKLCVPFADEAQRILVPAATGETTVGVFLLDPSAPGVALQAQTGTHHEPQFTLTLSRAEVPEIDVLGDPEQGEAIVRWTVERAQVALAATQLGVAQEALRRTAEYTSQRKQFGRPIGSFQGVALRAADAYIDVDCMRSTLWQALWLLSVERPAAAAVSVAKWWACRGGHRVVHTAQHLHGGIGSDVDYPIHRYFLWAKHLDVTLGGGSEQLARLGAQIAAGSHEAGA